MREQCRLLGAKRKSYARIELFRLCPNAELRFRLFLFRRLMWSKTIVETDANDVVGHMAACSDRRDRCDADQQVADASEVDVEIFGLHGPAVGDGHLNSGTQRPSQPESA